MLGAVSLNLYTPRVTDVAFALHLSPSGQGRPRRAGRAAPPGGARDGRIGGGAVSLGRESRTLCGFDDVQVDDFSKEQFRQERREQVRREHRAWVRGGKAGPEPVIEPDVIAGWRECPRHLLASCPQARHRCGRAGPTRLALRPPASKAGSVRRRASTWPSTWGGWSVLFGARDGLGGRAAGALPGSSRRRRLVAGAAGGLPIHVTVPIVRGTPAAAAAPAPACAQEVAELQRRIDASPWLGDSTVRQGGRHWRRRRPRPTHGRPRRLLAARTRADGGAPSPPFTRTPSACAIPMSWTPCSAVTTGCWPSGRRCPTT